MLGSAALKAQLTAKDNLECGYCGKVFDSSNVTGHHMRNICHKAPMGSGRLRSNSSKSKTTTCKGLKCESFCLDLESINNEAQWLVWVCVVGLSSLLPIH